jgi:hypothetical protein
MESFEYLQYLLPSRLLKPRDANTMAILGKTTWRTGEKRVPFAFQNTDGSNVRQLFDKYFSG